jgi:Zn-dependent protease
MDESSVVQGFAIWVLPVLFAITVHEVAHGWVASLFGDQTARLSGRLTLNPVKHIDPIGTVLVPFILFMTSGFIFGWAKPVPVDARNMRNPRWNMPIVAMAGPLSNLVMALIWASLAKLGVYLQAQELWGGAALQLMGMAGVQINVFLAVLNCIPVPPLDGGRVLMSILPPRMAYHFLVLQNYSFLILTVLLVTRVLQYVILPPAVFLIDLIMKVFAL